MFEGARFLEQGSTQRRLEGACVGVSAAAQFEIRGVIIHLDDAPASNRLAPKTVLVEGGFSFTREWVGLFMLYFAGRKLDGGEDLGIALALRVKLDGRRGEMAGTQPGAVGYGQAAYQSKNVLNRFCPAG